MNAGLYWMKRHQHCGVNGQVESQTDHSKTRCDPSPCRDHQYVDGVGALNHATNPSYPDTELRMRRIKTRTGPSVSGSTVAKTHFSNQNKQMNPLFQKLDRP